MSIVSRKFDRKDVGTVFRHAVTGKVLCRLEVKLTSEDREELLSLISLVYRAGENAGSKQRAAEIRQRWVYRVKTSQEMFEDIFSHQTVSPGWIRYDRV